MNFPTNPLRLIFATVLALAIASLAGCGAGGEDGDIGGGGGDDGASALPVGLESATYVSDGGIDPMKVEDMLITLGLQGQWRRAPSHGLIDWWTWVVPGSGHAGRYYHDWGLSSYYTDTTFGNITWLDTGHVGGYPAALLWTHYSADYDTPEVIVITSPVEYIHEKGNAGDRTQGMYVPL